MKASLAKWVDGSLGLTGLIGLSADIIYKIIWSSYVTQTVVNVILIIKADSYLMGKAGSWMLFPSLVLQALCGKKEKSEVRMDSLSEKLYW